MLDLYLIVLIPGSSGVSLSHLRVRQHLALVRVFLVGPVSRPVLSPRPAPSAGVSSCPAPAVFLQTGLRRPRLDLLPRKPPGTALAANLQEPACCCRPPSPPPPHPLPFISLFFLRPGFLPPSAGRLASSSPSSQGTGALWSPGHRFPPLWGAGLVNSASKEWPTLLGSCGLRFLRQLSGL